MNAMTMEPVPAKKPYFKNLSRRDYVQKAAQIIAEEGVEAVSIRRLSREMDCSTTTMYRHFRNLDELLFYAELGQLGTYIENLQCCARNWETVWDMHFSIWEEYAKEAFLRPEAYDLLFFRNIDMELGDALKEYYEMFPEAIVDVPPVIKRMLELPGYYERDYSILERMIEMGLMSEPTAKRINHIECNLYLGYFKAVMYARPSEEVAARATQTFLREIREIIAMYLWKDPVYLASCGGTIPESPFTPDSHNRIR